MNIKLLLDHIRQFIEPAAEEIEFLESVLISRLFRQGEVIVESGERARYLVFVNDGYTVTYYTDSDGKDHVIRFAAPGWWSGDIYSLSTTILTPFTTRALCDCEVLLLPKLAQNHLLEKHLKFERYFRNLFQTALIRHQMRFVESHSLTATKRYLKLLETFPGIEQFLPQKYMASYLGITPQFFSKMRKNVLNGNQT